MLTIFFKSLLNMLQYSSYFLFCSGDKACGDRSSLTRDWTCTPALESEVLTTKPPGKSQ